MQLDFFSLSITYPKTVKYSDEKINDDGYTVTYTTNDLKTNKRSYAAFSDVPMKATDITVSNVSNNKTYLSAKEITVSSSGIITSFSVIMVRSKKLIPTLLQKMGHIS